MNLANVKWPPKGWPDQWTNGQSSCIQCQHTPSDHHLIKGGDGVHRVFCNACPHPPTRFMGDQGTANPIPFFAEIPGPQTECFAERPVSRKIDNFLPLSPSKLGEQPLKGSPFVLWLGPKGGEEFAFSGIAWQAEEFEKLKQGERIDRTRYKLHLYWIQKGRCAGCKWYARFDNMEIDRIIPGDDGPGYTVGNVQLLCPSCNKIKGGRCMSYLAQRRTKQGLL